MTGMILVNVTPSTVGTQTKWDLEVVNTNKQGGYGNYPPVGIGKGDSNVLFVYQIQDGQGWSFAKDGAALWVANNGQDPKAPSSVPTEINPTTIHTSHKDQQLQFIDANGTAGQLNYTLNFVKGAQKASTLDPIIDNGGPGHFYDNYAADVAVITSAVALFLLFRPMFRKQRSMKQQRPIP